MPRSKNKKTDFDRNSSIALIITSAQFNTPCGPMIALADNNALFFLGFATRKNIQRDIDRIVKKNNAVLVIGATAPIESIQKELRDYFEGTLRVFKTPLHVVGSPFQKMVWDALQKILYGETISYATLAKNIGAPSAFRAVANANAANPFSIIIPCHRVIQKNGTLGGYNGGISCKQWLLKKEKDLIAHNKIL